MASNGVILLNLNNRNAAEFQRLSVPDSYEKASGALTAGTYVTVYKWLYQGFMLAPSLCDAVDATDHINLVDRTNGGIISVYPDDTITIEGGVSPDPDPEIQTFRAYHLTTGSQVEPYSLMLQKGHYLGTEFDWHWSPDDIILDGEPIEIKVSDCTGLNTPYLLPGCCTIGWSNGWILRGTQPGNQYIPSLGQWVGYGAYGLLAQYDPDANVNTYFCEDEPGAEHEATLVPLSVNANGLYTPSDYQADGFSEVNVSVQSTIEEVEPDFFGLATAYQGNTGDFFQEASKIQCLFIAPIQQGKNYVVFLPPVTSTRYRVATWQGKTISDFQPYLDNPGSSSSPVLTGGSLITPSTDPSPGTDGYKIRYFVPGVDGSIVIGTSNVSELVKPYLLKIEEE